MTAGLRSGAVIVMGYLIEVNKDNLMSQHAFRSTRRAAATERRNKLLFEMQQSKLEVSWELAKDRENAQHAQLAFAAVLEAKDVAISNLVSQLSMARQANMDMTVELTSLQYEHGLLANQVAEFVKAEYSVRSVGIGTSQKRRSLGTQVDLQGDSGSFASGSGTDELAQAHNHLENVRRVIEKALDHLSSAAEVATSVDNSSPGDSPEDWIDIFLKDYYCLLDPQGIRKREEDNERSDVELAEMDLSRFGHLFTFDRVQFWEKARAVPDEVRRDLEVFGAVHTPLTYAQTSSFYDYDSMYIHRDAMAFAWQEAYQDRQDDDELTALMKLLRRIV